MELQKRQVFFWLCLVIVTSALILYHMSATKTVIWSNQSAKGTSYPDDAIIPGHLNQVISEEEALQYEPCNDINLAANANLSTLRIVGSPNKVYNIGDKIFAQATLFDSYGKQKTTGGDHVRGRIYNIDLAAYAPGAVYDHNNGSYTIIFEALWSGVSNISATIAYTREAITAQYRLTATLVSLRPIIAKYQRQPYEEVAFCDPDNNHLIATTNHTDVCNFTSLNSGMPWYCGKPRHPKLKCTDWKLVKFVRTHWDASLSNCERVLLAKRFHRVLTKEVQVAVKERTQNNSSIKYYQPSASCVNYNTTRLWYEKYTSGFFFNMQWKLRHCEGFHRVSFQKCLRDKTLYLIGDSTVRQWYENIVRRYKCVQFTEKLAKVNRTKPRSCKVASNNLTVTKLWHSQPLYLVHYWADPKFTLISVAKQLERIGANEEAIVLIHVFLHNTNSLSKPFRDKMVKIRAGVEKLLKRNDKVKIFIKLPHTYTGVQTRYGAKNDFYGYIFSSIIIQTFRGIYDKVIVLDNKDATNAIASWGHHPEQTIVSSMVDQMFSYVCK